MNTPELDAMTNCPEVQDLAAFYEGNLSEPERLRILEHIADCGGCLDILDGLRAAETDNMLTEDVVVHARFGKRRTWLPSIAAAAALVVVFGAVFRERLFPGDPMRDVIEAGNQVSERPVDGRLSGDFVYKRASTMRGGVSSTEELPLDDYAVDIAAPKIAERAERNPTAKNLHASGVLHLFREDRVQAIADLNRAAKTNPNDAAVLTDLSAAYYANGDYQNAERTARRAVALERTPVTLWNLALALEQVKREREAIAVWQEYLKLDPSSEWSVEAKGKLDTLVKSLPASPAR